MCSQVQQAHARLGLKFERWFVARIGTIAILVFTLTGWGFFADTAKPGIQATTKADTEAAAKAEFDAAITALSGAEAALVPVRLALQKADAAYATTRKAADASRQKATESRNLAGEGGPKELKQAEEELAAATVKALADAEIAKAVAEKALADARAVVLPLRQAYAAAEHAAAEAEAVAKAALDAANRIEDEARIAAAEAAAKRRAADAALRKARGQPAPATRAAQSAEQAAQAAAKLAEEKDRAATQAVLKRRTAAEASAALTQVQQAQQQAQAQATAASQTLLESQALKKRADAALSVAREQGANAAVAYGAAEKAARQAADRAQQILADAAKPDAEKKQAVADAASKAKAADAAKAALAKGQEAEKTAQAQSVSAAKKLADAQKQKDEADTALASAQKQLLPAIAAHQAAHESAKELIQLDTASQQAAAEATVKRKTANTARGAFMSAQQKVEQAALRSTAAGQELTRAEARRKSAEAALVNLNTKIASAKQTFVADEEAAKAAEAAAAPLKEAAERGRAAYVAARKVADEHRARVDQAKAGLFHLVASRQMPAVMESPNPPKPANRIDELVFAKLNGLGIKPVLCSDAVFVRRAYLDLTGRLPSAEDARTFILSSDKDKRIALIDRLLDQSAHTDYWAMRWSDILKVKAEFPVKIWPNAAQAYHRWVWESIARDKRYDQFARELLTSSGSNFRVGAVNFYRGIQDRTPEGIAAAAGLALMNTRVMLWPQERRAGMAVFFSQVGYKPTSEWKEEIVFWDPLNSAAIPGNTAPGVDAIAKSITATNQVPRELEKPLEANGPLAAVFPDGSRTTIPATRDPREVFADWLIRAENPWFAKAIVNRTWAWVMGRGIIHEPDDIREDNPPSDPELLAYLTKELVSSGYDAKHLKRLILTSTTYQFSSIPRSTKPDARAHFASYALRRMEAEVLIDALNEITGGSDLYTSAVPEPFTYIPKNMSAVALPDGSITSSFLTLFGRSARAVGLESERVSELASTQWLYTLNSGAIQGKLQSGSKLAALLTPGGKPNEIAERLYLTILSRFPTDADVKVAEEYARTAAVKGREAWIDLAWALINSPEFLMRH